MRCVLFVFLRKVTERFSTERWGKIGKRARKVYYKLLCPAYTWHFTMKLTSFFASFLLCCNNHDFLFSWNIKHLKFLFMFFVSVHLFFIFKFFFLVKCIFVFVKNFWEGTSINWLEINCWIVLIIGVSAICKVMISTISLKAVIQITFLNLLNILYFVWIYFLLIWTEKS